MNTRPTTFLSELQRRNVYRAAVFYAASAWLLVQVATQVFPFFGFANWVVRWIVIAALIGFPFVLLFAWFYEWTPEGLKTRARRRALGVDHAPDRPQAGFLDHRRAGRRGGAAGARSVRGA